MTQNITSGGKGFPFEFFYFVSQKREKN